MRILFITATRLGDAVLSTGLLAHLLETYPHARFTIACGPVAAGLFDRMPRRDRTILIAKRRFDLHWLTLWAQLAPQTWDLAIDLRGSALTLFLRAKRRRIMRGGRRPGHRLTHLAGVLNLHPPPLPVIWTSPEDRAFAAARLGEGPIIGLGPTANWAGKIWPPERFATIANTLPIAKTAIFGGPGEAERQLARPLLQALPNAIDLVGQLTLPQAAACLARCSLYIGNDSGLMHLAAAAGAPTIGLFGASNAAEYAPAGRSTAVVEAPTMAALSVADVHASAMLLLAP